MADFTFCVASRRVRVAFTADPLADADGSPADALADWGNRRILISTRAPRPLVVEILLHELWHCWRFAVERPRTIEAECDLFAYAAVAAIEDLTIGGGVGGLLAAYDRAGAARPAAAAGRRAGR